ncbi:MAG: hypothetical protein HQ512_03460 [Rhodospirillales bacterium]|nr:hypothetical protein [Rhodospirillales bacterium]
MSRHLAFAALAAVIFGTAPVAACGPEVEIQFFESSSDIFAIKNSSQDPWFLVSLSIRLGGSRGRLVFDTEDGGPGASMHEPFGVVEDNVGFVSATPVDDGGEEVRLLFSDFQPGRSFMFVIDVDDRLENSDYGQAVVSGDEIEGANADAILTTKSGAQAKAKGRFGNDGRALLRGGLCA